MHPVQSGEHWIAADAGRNPLLHACGFTGPLLLHGLSESLVPGAVAFLREKLARLGPGIPTRGF
jgi:hypothetical protein